MSAFNRRFWTRIYRFSWRKKSKKSWSSSLDFWTCKIGNERWTKSVSTILTWFLQKCGRVVSYSIIFSMRIPRWAIGSAVLLAWWWGYWYFFMRDPAVSVTSQVVRVMEWSITSSVKTTGKISPVQTSLVSFTRQGTISKLYKNIGDTVTVGDVIAEIDASDAYMDIRNAKISLDNANNSYNKLYSSSTATDKIRAKNTLEESRNALVPRG